MTCLRNAIPRCCSVLVCALTLIPWQPGIAEDWPQFRGPNCAGVSTSDAALPAEFSRNEGVDWSVELADGIGSPVVAAGRVFTSAMLDESTVALYGFDADTGDQLWERSWETGPLPEIHKTNCHASSTPAADGERVYFYFSSLGLLCVDAVTGEDVWHAELPTPFFIFKWGAGMSPILYGDLVIFCQDDDLSPALYAFNKHTGDLVWSDDRTDMCVNYSHPVINTTPDGDELVVAGTGLLIGYDLATGERKWQARTLLRNIKTTPVAQGGIIYISVQSRGIANQWIQSIDRWETGNKDGRVTKDEIQAFFGEAPVPESFYARTFDRGDVNGDGALSGEELDIAFLPPGNAAGASYDSEDAEDEFIIAVRGGGTGDVTDTHILWKHPTQYTDHIVSPLVHNGRMLLIKGGGIATCFETEHGEPLWGPKRINNASEYFASPIVGDGKIYIAAENGMIIVLRDSAELDVLAVNDMGSPVLGTPAISDGRLIVRTRDALLCVTENPQP